MTNTGVTMDGFFMTKTITMIVILALALYYDVKEQKIKNFITIPAAVTGIAINLTERGLEGVFLSLQGWIVPVLALMVFYAIKVMGAGDIKLFAALGAIMGLKFVIYSFIYTVYIGAVIAFFLLVRRNQFKKRLMYLGSYFRNCFLTGKLYPYSTAGERESKFIFTLALVPGTLLQYCCVLFGIGERM